MAEKNLELEMYGAIRELGAKFEAADRSRLEFQSRLENTIDEIGQQLKEVHNKQDSLSKTQDKHTDEIATLKDWKEQVSPKFEKVDAMYSIYFYIKKHWLKILILSFVLFALPLMAWVLWIVNSHAIDVPFFAHIAEFFIDPAANKYLGDGAYHNYLVESAIH